MNDSATPQIPSVSIISTDGAGKPDAPTTQGAVANGFVYTSGHGPRRRGNGGLAIDSFRAQVEQTLSNITAVLEAGGSSLAHCVCLMVVLRSPSYSAEFNAVYSELVPEPYPPRMMIYADLAHHEVLIEMQAVGAVVPNAGGLHCE